MTRWCSMQWPISRSLLTPFVGNAWLLSILGTLLLVSSHMSVVGGANIAFFHPTGTYSHRVSVWPLVEKLVANGHHITFISAYPPKDPLPNVTEIIPESMAQYINDYLQGGDLDISRRVNGEMEHCYDNAPGMGILSCEKFLDDPSIKAWLKTEPKFDLFVVDWFLSECILGMVYKAKAPFIFYAPSVMVAIFYETFGFLPDSAGVPDFEYHFTPPMNLWQRAINAIQPIIWKYKMNAYYDKIGELIREKMDLPDLPPLVDIVRNASLMLWSESFVEGYAHTLPPNWITVWGMHCKEKPDPLPAEIEKVALQGKDGFIYISFGSAVVPGNLPEGHKQAFFNAIKKFPNIQFMWKWTGKSPKKEDIPSNLYIGNWFPQQDVLAHKRILAFVTQAGRPSTQEAVFHGVPIISFPVFEDQDSSAERIRDNGAGLSLEIATITEEELVEAFKEIINPKYKETMKQLSKLFKDRPMHPADTALWWTEYVLRHKNLDHLRSPAYHLTWYQRRLLDVWAIFIVGALLILGIILYIIIRCLRLLFRDKPAKNKSVNGLKKNQ